MLERFVTAKQAELDSLRKAEAEGTLPPAWKGQRPDFAAAICQPTGQARLGVIAEYKRASPSRGVIRQDLEVEEVASQYTAAGARAISVLTEEAHFQGRLEYLARAAATPGVEKMPLLRKDFIFDRLQVLATAATPAAAMLLIVRLTPDVDQLRQLRELGESHGLAAVVEVFDKADLVLARQSGARIIQVNARDLQKLTVDRAACLELARKDPPRAGEIWIAASGMEKPADLAEAADAGYNAALVGTALMAGSDQPGAALARLTGGDQPC